MSLLVRNIKQLVLTEDSPRTKVTAAEMKELPGINDAWLLMENDTIVDFGPMSTCPEPAGQTFNAEGKMVLPAWCDSHTHLVYAGSREGEFVDRIKGLTYEEIAQKGGGILNSAKRLQDTPEEELLEQAYHRIGEIKDMGTGAVEIKSGYGLTVDAELKMLRVINKLKGISPLTIRSTFLGAHAIPTAHKENREEYIRQVIEEMLPKVAEENLADYVDVFCDEGFYTPDETEQIMVAADQYGLKGKIHGNELANSGGVQVAVKNNALTIDHLEAAGKDEIEALKSSDIMPCIMPTVAFFLNIPPAPARDILDAGKEICIASDYNPGSSPSGNMPFVVALACIQQRMTPEEAINAATLNGAYAMGLEKTHGSIAKGKKANVIITKKLNSLAFLPYAFGSDLVETVIINGEIQ
jgi:imidazolonepropionase